MEVADQCPRTLYVVIDSPQAHKQWRNSRGLGNVVSTPLLGLLSLIPARAPAVAFDLGEWIPGLKLSPFFSERVEYESSVFRVPSHSRGGLRYSILNRPLGVQQ